MKGQDTSHSRRVGAVRRALDAHRRALAYDLGTGAQCTCGATYDSAEGWKRHQAQEATSAAESVTAQQTDQTTQATTCLCGEVLMPGFGWHSCDALYGIRISENPTQGD